MLEVRAATADDLESAGECIAEAFSGGNPTQYEEIREEVREHATGDPFQTISDLRVGVIDGVVVSAAAVLPRGVHGVGVT